MKKLLLGLGIFIPFILIVYGFLGGFNALEFKLNEDPPVYHLLGKAYNGSHNSEEVTNLFQELQAFQIEYRKDSSVTIVSFDQGEDEDNVHYFVSINLIKGIDLREEGFEYREYSPLSILSVRLSGHPIVLPSVEKVIAKTKIYAKENNKQLQGYSIETYYPDGTIQVDFPLKVR